MIKLSKKATAFLLSLFLLTPNFVQAQNDTNELEPVEFSNASVHDPSIIQDKENEMYYVFGSHIDAAKSSDLINWSNFTNGYTTPNNALYGDLSANLAESFEWAGEDDADSFGGYAVWAPDIFWNEDFVNEDGTTGAYLMYYCVLQ